MKIFVTGGSGFIGSNFIRYILEKHPDYEVTNFDKLTYCGNPENLKDIENNSKYHFLKGDICDEKLVEESVKGHAAIVHFAAESHVDNSISGPKIFVETNVIGTLNLLEVAKKENIQKFLFISTDEVYGSVEQGSSIETDLIETNSPYSASKAAAELLVRAYNITHKVPTIITRSSNNFGPYQYPEKLIPLFITNLIEGKKVPLYGDGLNVRDGIYVLDNCEALDFVLHNGKIGETYNIGGGTEKKNVEITEIVLNKLGKGKDSIEYVEDRKGHDRRYSLSSEKLKNLGWQPKFSFEEAMEKTVEWYKNNEEWWGKLKK
jgi:dTDP-glucose 4,6-dehydratase